MDKKQAILEAFDKRFGRLGGYSFEYYRDGLEEILTAQEGECIHGADCPMCADNWMELMIESEAETAKRKIEKWWNENSDKFNTYWRVKPSEVIAELLKSLDKDGE